MAASTATMMTVAVVPAAIVAPCTTASTSAPARSNVRSAPVARSLWLVGRSVNYTALRMSRSVAAKRPSSVASAVASAPSSLERPTGTTTFHFLVADSKWLLDDLEEFKELMDERKRYFNEKNFERNFWLVQEPEFLAQFPDIAAKFSGPKTAVVSTDNLWITFMKVRLDKVVEGKFDSPSEKIPVPLKSSAPVPEFESPSKWTAPYTKYEGGWWTEYEPVNSN